MEKIKAGETVFTKKGAGRLLEAGIKCVVCVSNKGNLFIATPNGNHYHVKESEVVTDIETIALANPLIKVLAKRISDERLRTVTYTNDKQANKKVSDLKSAGIDAEVYTSPVRRIRFIKINSKP